MARARLLFKLSQYRVIKRGQFHLVCVFSPVATLGLSALIDDTDSAAAGCGSTGCFLTNTQILNYGLQQFFYGGGDLSNFIGVGQFGMTMSASTDLGLDPLGAFADTSTFDSSSNWSTRVSLEYVYTPRARVPEPGTLALFAAGIIGLGAAARRRRKRA